MGMSNNPRNIVPAVQVKTLDADRKLAILGHTVSLTEQLLTQRPGYDAYAVSEIIPVIFKALDEASR